MNRRKSGALRALRLALISLLALIALFFAVRAAGAAVNKRTPDGGINEALYVDINDSRQWISIYGESTGNPVLLYLHGGPGSPTSAYDYAFTRKWADVYTVVTWDQRNCGMSRFSSPEEGLSCGQLVEDGIALTEFLRSYLGTERITLLGHSWGSWLGCRMALEKPEYYECFIGAGQLVDMRENERLLASEAAKWAEGDPEGQKLLSRLNPEQPDMEHYAARNKLMERYGYGLFANGRDYSLPAAVIFNPYYGIGDWIERLRGGNAYVNLLLSEEFASLSLPEGARYELPFYSINGDRDYQVNYGLSREYFDSVDAPYKEFFTMEGMTHGLLESRSGEFSDIIHEIASQRSELRR